MNLEPKLLLSINLLSNLSQNKECIEINWEKSTQNNAEIIIARGKTKHYQRIQNNAIRRLKISQFAFDNFTSNEIPSNYNKRIYKGKSWSELKESDKLDFHLSSLADGKTFSYEILN